jgi:hypothetical protein
MPAETPNVYTYPRQEPGTLGHLDLVEPLRAMPRDLAALLKGLREADVTRRPDDGGWCIKEIVGHLRDSIEVDHKRLYMMSTQTDPILEPFDPDAWVTEHDYMSRNVDEMLADLRNYRGKTVQLLTSLVNWNWARTGQHLERGRTSIRQTVEYMVQHEAQHLDEIRRLRALAEPA